MKLFNFHSIERMAAENDRNGLYRLLEDRNKNTRLEAALALAELEDGAGWRFLMDTVRQADDPESQMMAATMLADLGHARAIPALEEALKQARGETANVIKEALEAIGGGEAEDALRETGFEPVLPHIGSIQLVEYSDQLVRGMQPDTSQVRFLTAEQHFDHAAELRESQFSERGLVENAVALWLAPNWAYAWYLRGVLFEDLDRYAEAILSYRYALELDSTLPEARAALEDIESEHALPPEIVDILLADLASRHWSDRRDAAAVLGGMPNNEKRVVARLVELVSDEDREVRHAAIEALGCIDDPAAVDGLVERQEDTWLLRFAVIETLMNLKAVDGLAVVLRREMSQIQARNPLFSAQKDPLLEEEYQQLMEIGVLAFENTGDVNALIDLVQGNAWVEIDTGDDESEDEFLDEEEVDEDLESYVDETAQMASLALERLVLPQMDQLGKDTLRRLIQVPDLTLVDLSAETGEVPIYTTVHDFTALREAAEIELAKRNG